MLLIQTEPNWPLINSIGTLITWTSFVIIILRYKQDQKKEAREKEKIKRELEKANEELIKRVCEQYISSDEYIARKEKRIRELSQMEINTAFSQRAESFVDSKEYKADRRHIHETMSRIEKAIAENTKTVAELNGKLTTMVLREPKLDFDDSHSRRNK